MKSTIFAAVAVLASSALAQTATSTAAFPTSSSSTCEAQQVLDACLATQQDRLSLCGDTDYSCKCGVYGDFITCYNQCPSDTGVIQYQTQQSTYCALNSQYPSSTTVAVTATSTAKSASTTTGTSTGTKTSSSGTATGTSSESSSSSTADSGANRVMSAGGFLAAVAAVAAALL